MVLGAPGSSSCCCGGGCGDLLFDCFLLRVRKCGFVCQFVKCFVIDDAVCCFDDSQEFVFV